jgi:chorismate lyase
LSPIAVGAHAAILRRWLRAPGSLSKRLAAMGARFEVQTLHHGPGPLHAAERADLAMRPPNRSWIREVILRVDGEPLIWARSVAPSRSLAGPWRALVGLGTRPLADLLFKEPRVTRSPLVKERLQRGGPMRRRLEREWLQATGLAAPHNMVWARSSVFRKHGVPLRVMEAFAPCLSRVRPTAITPANRRAKAFMSRPVQVMQTLHDEW